MATENPDGVPAHASQVQEFPNKARGYWPPATCTKRRRRAGAQRRTGRDSPDETGGNRVCGGISGPSGTEPEVLPTGGVGRQPLQKAVGLPIIWGPHPDQGAVVRRRFQGALGGQTPGGRGSKSSPGLPEVGGPGRHKHRGGQRIVQTPKGYLLSTNSVLVYDNVYGGLGLTEALWWNLEEYAEQLLRGAATERRRRARISILPENARQLVGC